MPQPNQKKKTKNAAPSKKALPEPPSSLLDDEDPFIGNSVPQGKDLDDVEEFTDDDEDKLLDGLAKGPKHPDVDEVEDDDEAEDEDDSDDGYDEEEERAKAAMRNYQQMRGGGGADPRVDELQGDIQELGDGLRNATDEIANLKNQNTKDRNKLKKKERRIKQELIIGGARWIIISVLSLFLVALASWAALKFLDTNYGLLVMLVLFGLWSILKDHVRSGFGQIRDIILKHFGTDDDIEAEYR